MIEKDEKENAVHLREKSERRFGLLKGFAFCRAFL